MVEFVLEFLPDNLSDLWLECPSIVAHHLRERNGVSGDCFKSLGMIIMDAGEKFRRTILGQVMEQPLASCSRQ